MEVYLERKGINGVNYGVGRKFPPPVSKMLLNCLWVVAQLAMLVVVIPVYHNV